MVTERLDSWINFMAEKVIVVIGRAKTRMFSQLLVFEFELVSEHAQWQRVWIVVVDSLMKSRLRQVRLRVFKNCDFAKTSEILMYNVLSIEPCIQWFPHF